MRKYFVINPRTEVETEKVFAENSVYGIEVVGKWASRCRFNLDPQHGGMGVKESIAAARKATVISELPKDDEVIVFSRVDPDAVAAAVVLEGRSSGKLNNESGFPIGLSLRLDLLCSIDEFNHEKWRHQSLPTESNKWPNGYSPEYSALAANLFDFKLPIEQRVEAMEYYLYDGAISDTYLQIVVDERNELIRALDAGEILFKEVHPCIALVETSHRAATIVGYSIDPVIICINPSFSFQGNPPIRKVTIAEYAEGYLDIEGLSEELNKLETGWGGNKTLLGSPMGKDCTIETEKLIELTNKYIQ